jgi:hypothetical protein
LTAHTLDLYASTLTCRRIVLARIPILLLHPTSIPYFKECANGRMCEVGESRFQIDDPVLTRDGRRGVVKYIGSVPELGVTHCVVGVAFTSDVGKHDGQVSGTLT